MTHGDRQVDFERIAAKMSPIAAGEISRGKFMLKATVDKYVITVFRDGRTIIKGTKIPDEAKTVYAKYIGT